MIAHRCVVPGRDSLILCRRQPTDKSVGYYLSSLTGLTTDAIGSPGLFWRIFKNIRLGYPDQGTACFERGRPF